MEDAVLAAVDSHDCLSAPQVGTRHTGKQVVFHPGVQAARIRTAKNATARSLDRPGGTSGAAISALRDDVARDSDGASGCAWTLADRQPTDFAAYTGVADLDALFAILEPWSVLRPWDFAWALAMTDVRQQSEGRAVRPPDARRCSWHKEP
jgi:hypothetical protein